MRITIVQGAYLPVPPLLGGAVEKVWFALGKFFVRKGHQVTQVSRQFPGLPERETIEGVRHIRVPSFDAPKSATLFRLLDLVYAWRVLSVLPKADICVTCDIWAPILLRKRKYGKLYVNVNRFPKGQMWLYKHADRLQGVSVAVCEAIKNELPNCGKKIKCIPNPLPFDIPKVDLQVHWGKRENTILYVGRIHPEKGLEVLIEAFLLFQQKNPSWRLKIVGPWSVRQGGGGEAYLGVLKRKCSAFHDSVSWVEPEFDFEKLKEHYRNARIFVYPSLAETGESFGLAPLEAMAYGCPVVVSDLECFKDFFLDGVCGKAWVRKTGCKGLAEELQAMAFSSGPEKSLNCFQKAKEFSFERVGQAHIEDFSELLGSHGN